MRLLLAALLSVLPVAAPAADSKAPLTRSQTRFLLSMAERMESTLQRRHARSPNRALLRKPVVRFDRSKRRIVVTNRLKKHVDAAVRDALKRHLEDQRPNLCLALRPRAMRETGATIAVRMLRDDGRTIGTAVAAPETC